MSERDCGCGLIAKPTGDDRADASHREHDDDWILQPIQKGGSVNTFFKHISTG